jgi:hypothetical protein
MDAYAAVIETKRPMFSKGIPVRVPANLPEIAQTGPLG